VLGIGYNNCRNDPRKVSCRDIEDAEGAFEDLHVQITADTILKKVDAAVAQIEMCYSSPYFYCWSL
jgi:hypothetical protein